MAWTRRKEGRQQVRRRVGAQGSGKAETCPHCGAPIPDRTGKKPKKWHERTSVTLCIAAGLIIVAFGFVHVITGVVSPYDLPFDIVLKDSFGYRETFVNAEKIKALPYLAAKKKYPIGCKALQKGDYLPSGRVFETRTVRHLAENLNKWQAEFSAGRLTAEQTMGTPRPHWQDQWFDRLTTLSGAEGLQAESQIPRIDPEDAKAYNDRGITSAKNAQYENAIAAFSRAVTRDPVFAEAYYNRAIVYVALGQLGPAISDFTKVIEIKPALPEGYTHRGLLHVALSQYDQAISDFTKVLEIDPASAETHFRRSLAFYAKGQYDKAWQDIRRIQGLGLHVPAEFLDSLRAVSGQ